MVFQDGGRASRQVQKQANGIFAGYQSRHRDWISRDIQHHRRSKVKLKTWGEAQLNTESFLKKHHGNSENNLAKTGAPADP